MKLFLSYLLEFIGFFQFFILIFIFNLDVFEYPTDFGEQDCLYDLVGQCVTKSYTLTHGNQKVFSFLKNLWGVASHLYTIDKQIFMREELIESKYAFSIASQYLSLALEWEKQSVERLEERLQRGEQGEGDAELQKSLKDRQQRLGPSQFQEFLEFCF